MGEDGDFGVWSLNKQVEHKKMCPEAMSQSPRSLWFSAGVCGYNPAYSSKTL